MKRIVFVLLGGFFLGCVGCQPEPELDRASLGNIRSELPELPDCPKTIPLSEGLGCEGESCLTLIRVLKNRDQQLAKNQTEKQKKRDDSQNATDEK